MIDVESLIFEYPGQRALDDVSFSIPHNSVTALVGPNGAGKTTLMRCLCGLERPLAGSIRIDGIDVIDEPRLSHERLGYLSDFFGLYDALSVRRVLSYAASANGKTGDLRDAVDETASRLRLSDRLGQTVGELSRGLRQRVAIGQALIHDPGVLILDEPASGLDPEARHDLAELFRLLQKSGMTLLVSSHILAELEAYATEMLVIRDGRIVEQRALKETTPARRQLLIEVGGVAEHAVKMLNNRADVHDVRVDRQRIFCEVSGDDATQAQILKDLVGADIAVINFSIVERDLQQSYLDSMQKPR